MHHRAFPERVQTVLAPVPCQHGPWHPGQRPPTPSCSWETITDGTRSKLRRTRTETEQGRSKTEKSRRACGAGSAARAHEQNSELLGGQETPQHSIPLRAGGRENREQMGRARREAAGGSQTCRQRGEPPCMDFSSKNTFRLDLKLRRKDTITSCLQGHRHYAKDPAWKAGGGTAHPHEAEESGTVTAPPDAAGRGGAFGTRGVSRCSRRHCTRMRRRPEPASRRHSCRTGCRAEEAQGSGRRPRARGQWVGASFQAP